MILDSKDQYFRLANEYTLSYLCKSYDIKDLGGKIKHDDPKFKFLHALKTRENISYTELFQRIDKAGLDLTKIIASFGKTHEELLSSYLRAWEALNKSEREMELFDDGTLAYFHSQDSFISHHYSSSR